MTDTDRPGPPPAGPEAATRRPNRVLLLVLAGIALVAALAGVLVAQRGGPGYDPATPEGTVAAYLDAVLHGDADRAARLLAPGTRCTVADLDRADLPDDVRVTLREVRVSGDTARVDVGAALPSGDLFGGTETFEEHVLRLARHDGTWLLTGEPWPASGCGTGD